ncbi:GNAT family N-acetyltransferase [uncultured Psychromonas sp.]|uniref:GNAT family N-acetyltransferase n=1 Tax=uncultured Psychromonas sp. TaxID=173974 RepID=UPI0026264396|nr:GNAT family N-acetyltransferase [uncultured Psychromonas sp.]
MFAWEIKFFSELSAQRLYQILKLRQDVFVLEQTCLYPDLDNLDQKVIHVSLISEEDDDLVAYCRIIPADLVSPDVAIGRVVVAEGARSQGLAKKLMIKAIEFTNEEMQAPAIKVSAQSHLQAFYQSLGFAITSEPYDEDGIEHIDMKLTILS